jgi:tetrahydromethanopterin S-methyltransferase subunit D
MMSEQESAMKTGNMIEVPASTPWPFVTAFGLALICAGLVTTLAVSVVGLVVVFAGAVGWFRNVLPVQQQESIKVVRTLSVARSARSTRRVDHLQPGTEGHRVYIPITVHPYSAGLIGGVLGGIGMAIIACLYGLIAQGSLWYPVNLLAAAALPSLAEAGPAELKAFHLSGFVVALLSHGIISLLVGLLYAAILPMMPSRFTAFWGSFLAPVLWTALVASTLSLINPALNARIAWGWFIASQVAFGLITGFVVAHTKEVETAQSWPLAARAGMEAPGVMPEKEAEQ